MKFKGKIQINKTGLYVLFALILILFVFTISRNNSNKIITNTISLRQLLETAIVSAQNGGLQIVNAKDNLKIKSKGKTKEGAEDSVTTADFKSHCAMIKTIKYNFPHLLVISEEAKTKCDDSNYDVSAKVQMNYLDEELVAEDDVTVWIDPLDATQEYTEKLYEYVTTMVCVAVKGKPVVGVIHNPFTKNTTWGWVGVGISNDLSKHKETNSNKVTVTVSRSHSGQIREVLKKQFSDEQLNIEVAAGAGYKALLVATGKVDAYLHITAIKKWDICAGNAILNAIGGKMTTKYNDVINYADTQNVINEDGIIATLKNHDLFIDKL